MTAEEIRALPADNMNATDQALLREIAAQLAEHNEREQKSLEQSVKELWAKGWRP